MVKFSEQHVSTEQTTNPDPRRTRRRRVPVKAAAPPVAARTGWKPVLATLPLVCVALGGGTARWSQGIVLLAQGGLLLAFPPRKGLGRGLDGVLAGLCALALAAFLPAGWFARPDWRAALTDDFGLVLPATLSPQPWLSAEAAVLFLAGICWFYRMATVRWGSEERLRAGRIFAGGTVVLAGLFTVFYKQGILVPFWLTERHFGPFPNRNQTADFLAVGALPVLGCMFVSWRAGRRGAAAGWLAGWLVVAVAVFNNFSRAGVGILFIGTVAFVGTEVIRSARRRPPPIREVKPGDPLPDRAIAIARWRQASLAASLVLVLASGFFLFGGETLGRFQFGQAAGGTQEVVTDEFRARLQRDALDMIVASPVCGVGLGNFAPVFELFRHRSLAPVWIVHPESDWLWMAAELGWPAVVWVLVGCVLLARRMWPWRRGAERPLRMAAALGLGLFALHGFVDVSAHRLGTVLCALFLLGLALPERAEDADMPASAAWWPGGVFRVMGLVLVGAGSLWLVEAFGWVTLPGEIGVARLKARTVQMGRIGDYAGAERAATQALGWAPLDWELYFARASARVYQRRDPQAAVDDFRRARYLEPFAGGECYLEARLWAAADASDLAANALAEACRREPEHAERYIRDVASVAADGEAVFRERFHRTLRRDPVLAMAYLQSINLGSAGRKSPPS